MFRPGTRGFLTKRAVTLQILTSGLEGNTPTISLTTAIHCKSSMSAVAAVVGISVSTAISPTTRVQSFLHRQVILITKPISCISNVVTRMVKYRGPAPERIQGAAQMSSYKQPPVSGDANHPSPPDSVSGKVTKQTPSASRPAPVLGKAKKE